MFPVLAIIMEASVQIEGGLEENYFVMLFATMYIGMAPLTGMATVIAEEKEKHTLRMLIMSNVRAYEYLIGVGMYVLVACMIGSLSFGLTAGYTGSKLLLFVLVMATGILLSTLLGGAVIGGVGSKNQMAATSIVVPVMIFFSFLPMIAMFNKTIEAVSRFTYSQQVNYLLKDIQTLSVTNENIYVIGGNLLLILVLFRYAYMKSRFA